MENRDGLNIAGFSKKSFQQAAGKGRLTFSKQVYQTAPAPAGTGGIKFI